MPQRATRGIKPSVISISRRATHLIAQGDGSWIACQFVVDNHDGRGAVIKGANRSDANETVNAFVYCLDKSA